jgi:glutamate/tyrosine decarboxylase-like PLP-dependent enzyme
MPIDPVLELLSGGLAKLERHFPRLAAAPVEAPSSKVTGSMANVVDLVAERIADNYPYFHPLYAGQMLKPPHPVAHAAYALAMYLNPNNHALDGGRASSQMEVEAVQQIAAGLFHWTKFLGHLTSSGTFANLEALWVARQLHPGKRVVGSEQAHYTHSRISSVLGMAYSAVATDLYGRMSVDALKEHLRRGDVGTVVVTLGTTATGAVDPLQQVLDLQSEYSFRIHVDAAYGGYFALANNLSPASAEAFTSLPHADSIAVDPHKHGLQPYGCGCVLFRDPAVGRFYKHDSPYTYFTSGDLHLGEISLECSRAGAAAVALWATQRLLPLTRDGEFSANLSRGRQAAIQLHRKLTADRRFLVPFPPELDILVWAVAAPDAAQASRSAKQIFDAAARRGLHLALAELPARFFDCWRIPDAPEKTVTCLRSVLMKPEHLDWLDEIWSRIDGSADEVLKGASS